MFDGAPGTGIPLRASHAKMRHVTRNLHSHWDPVGSLIPIIHLIDDLIEKESMMWIQDQVIQPVVSTMETRLAGERIR